MSSSRWTDHRNMVTLYEHSQPKILLSDEKVHTTSSYTNMNKSETHLQGKEVDPKVTFIWHSETDKTLGMESKSQGLSGIGDGRIFALSQNSAPHPQGPEILVNDNVSPSPFQFLIIVKGKNSNFVVAYPGQNHIYQVLEVSITSNKTSVSWTLHDDVL